MRLRPAVLDLLKAGALGLVCVAAFLAARLPLDWWPGRPLNGLDRPMIGTNFGLDEAWVASVGLNEAWADRLGLGQPEASTPVPLHDRYFHP